MNYTNCLRQVRTGGQWLKPVEPGKQKAGGTQEIEIAMARELVLAGRLTRNQEQMEQILVELPTGKEEQVLAWLLASTKSRCQQRKWKTKT